MDEEGEAGDGRVIEDRPRGVPKARLADMNLEPKLSIFYRPDPKAGMLPLEAAFPKEAATIFCDRIHSAMERNKGDRSYLITGGDLSAYKKIFAWINDCVQSQSIEKFPDITEPEEDPFTPTVNILIAGNYLGIPAGSLSFHLKKRLQGCARKRLMPFSQVRQFYDVNSEPYSLGLKDVACASIFNAWWDMRLDESVNPELMEELSDLRDELKELDADLHEACSVREQEIRKKWAEKKAKKFAEQAGTSNKRENFGTAAVNDGWDMPADTHNSTRTTANGGWDYPTNATTENASACWDQSIKAVGDSQDLQDQTTTTQNWADEMNEPSQQAFLTAPGPQW